MHRIITTLYSIILVVHTDKKPAVGHGMHRVIEHTPHRPVWQREKSSNVMIL